MTDYLKSIMGGLDVSLARSDLRPTTRKHLTLIRNSAVEVLAEKAFYCRVCNFNTNDPHEAIDHKLQVHDNMSGIPGWFCRDCNFRSLTHDHVVDHIDWPLFHHMFRLNEEATPKPKEVSK